MRAFSFVEDTVSELRGADQGQDLQESVPVACWQHLVCRKGTPLQRQSPSCKSATPEPTPTTFPAVSKSSGSQQMAFSTRWTCGWLQCYAPRLNSDDGVVLGEWRLQVFGSARVHRVRTAGHTSPAAERPTQDRRGLFRQCGNWCRLIPPDLVRGSCWLTVQGSTGALWLSCACRWRHGLHQTCLFCQARTLRVQ